MAGFFALPAGVVKSLFNGLKTICALQPALDLGSLAGRGQSHYGSSGHAVGQNATVGSASQLSESQIQYTLARYHKNTFWIKRNFLLCNSFFRGLMHLITAGRSDT